MRVDALLSVASLLHPTSPPCHGRAAVMSSTEFSRPLGVDRKQKHQRMELSASPEECAGLCKRFDLEGLDSLVANVTLSRIKLTEDTLRVRAVGSMTGLGVSRKNFGGEPMTLDVRSVDFEAFYGTEPEEGEQGGQIDMSNDEAFDEPIIDGSIDLVRPVPYHPKLTGHGPQATGHRPPHPHAATPSPGRHAATPPRRHAATLPRCRALHRGPRPSERASAPPPSAGRARLATVLPAPLRAHAAGSGRVYRP